MSPADENDRPRHHHDRLRHCRCLWLAPGRQHAAPVDHSSHGLRIRYVISPSKAQEQQFFDRLISCIDMHRVRKEKTKGKGGKRKKKTSNQNSTSQVQLISLIHPTIRSLTDYRCLTNALLTRITGPYCFENSENRKRRERPQSVTGCKISKLSPRLVFRNRHHRTVTTAGIRQVFGLNWLALTEELR